MPSVNTQPMQQPLETAQPIAQTQFSAPPPQKNMKGLILLFVFIIILILGGLGAFLFINNKPATPPIQTQVSPTPIVSVVSPTPLPIPSPKVTQSPEEALQQVTIDDPNADIQNINADAQQL